MGEFFGKIMSTITVEQATYRVQFKELNPTNRHKDKKKDYADALIKHEYDFDLAFPMSRLSKLSKRSTRRRHA